MIGLGDRRIIARTEVEEDLVMLIWEDEDDWLNVRDWEINTTYSQELTMTTITQDNASIIDTEICSECEAIFKCLDDERCETCACTISHTAESSSATEGT